VFVDTKTIRMKSLETVGVVRDNAVIGRVKSDQNHFSGNATNRGENRAHQISIAFVVVSPDVERANPVRGTWNTILDAVHGFSLARDCQSIFNFGLSERLWRVARHTSLACLGHHFAIGYPAVQVAGLWLLIGAPLTLWLPYAVCRMAHACSQNRLACP
jgi:hypothetical protein